VTINKLYHYNFVNTYYNEFIAYNIYFCLICHILQSLVHGILFTIMFYLTYNHLEYTEKEGITIGNYKTNQDEKTYDIEISGNPLGALSNVFSSSPPPSDKVEYNNHVEVFNKSGSPVDELTKMPPYDYSKFRNYDYESMKKKVEMLETHQHSNEYYDLVPNFNKMNSEILCAADYGTNTTCCRQPDNYVSDENVCGPLKPYCTNYIHGIQWGKCVATNPHPKPNLGNHEKTVITKKTIIQPGADVINTVYSSPDIQSTMVYSCPAPAPADNLINIDGSFPYREGGFSKNKDYERYTRGWALSNGFNGSNEECENLCNEQPECMNGGCESILYEDDKRCYCKFTPPSPVSCVSSEFMVAGGGGKNNIAWSEDGKNWTGISNAEIGPRGLAWNGSIWVAVGSGTNSIAWSEDGKTWNGLGTTVFNNDYEGGRGVAWNGSMWVAVGKGGTNSIAWSEDGKTWNGLGSSIFSDGYSVAWNGSMWVAVGVPPSGWRTQGGNSIAWSEDGKTWNYMNDWNFFGNDGGMKIAWNGSIWVAGGVGGNGGTLAWSEDGKNWTSVPNWQNRGNARCSGLAWNGSMWLATGVGIDGNNTISRSEDGKNWTSVSNTENNGGTDVAWNGSVWVILGNQTNTMAWSNDGENWTGLGRQIFVTYGLAIASKNVLPYTDKWANCH
jgi:hypothetical protein